MSKDTTTQQSYRKSKLAHLGGPLACIQPIKAHMVKSIHLLPPQSFINCPKASLFRRVYFPCLSLPTLTQVCRCCSRSFSSIFFFTSSSQPRVDHSLLYECRSCCRLCCVNISSNNNQHTSFSFAEAVFIPPCCSSHHEVNGLILLLTKVLTTCFGPAFSLLSCLILHFR